MRAAACNEAGLKAEPRLQTSMLRGWQHLRRTSPGHHLYCDVPIGWILRATGSEADPSRAGPQRVHQVDFVLCNRKDVPLVVVHLIDGPGLKHRREREMVQAVNRTLRILSSAGIRIWVWDAHALPPLDVLRRQVLRLDSPSGASGRLPSEFEAGRGTSSGWPGMQIHRLLSIFCHPLVAIRASRRRAGARRVTRDPAGAARRPVDSEWRRLAPVLHGLDEIVLRDMVHALERLLDRVPAARRVLRHVGALEWGLKRLGTHAFLKLPLDVLEGAEWQLADLVGADRDARAIAALRAKLRSALALRRAPRFGHGRTEADDASGVTNIEVREIGMSTFVEADSTW